MVPDTPDVEAVLFGPNGVAEGLKPGTLVIDMSSISPIATKEFAKKINALGCDYLDAPVSGGEVGAQAGDADHHGGRPRRGIRARQAAVRDDGQEHHPCRAETNGDGQTCKVANQIIVALNIQACRRGAGVRRQGRRRPGQGAAGADGRLRLLAHPGGACRAHAERHVQPGLPHPAAPEGPEPGAVGGARSSTCRCRIPRSRSRCFPPARRMAGRIWTIRR